jgi:hypothetical protein
MDLEGLHGPARIRFIGSCLRDAWLPEPEVPGLMLKHQRGPLSQASLVPSEPQRIDIEKVCLGTIFRQIVTVSSRTQRYSVSWKQSHRRSRAGLYPRRQHSSWDLLLPTQGKIIGDQLQGETPGVSCYITSQKAGTTSVYGGLL